MPITKDERQRALELARQPIRFEEEEAALEAVCARCLYEQAEPDSGYCGACSLGDDREIEDETQPAA